MKKSNVDVVGGNLFSSMIVFSVPLILGSLVQTFFHSADIIVLGQMADQNAVAAVGASSPIVSLIVNSFISLSGGVSILLSRYFGAKEKEKTRETVDTAILSSVLVGLLLAVIGIAFAPGFLRLTDCPDECFDGALVYLRFYFAGIPVILLYNFGAAIIRVSGDSQKPLTYLIVSGVLNLVLNVFFCAILTQKVAAVALATFLSQLLGAVLVVRYLCRADNDCRLTSLRLKMNFPIFAKIMRFGLPCALNTALYSVSNLQIQSAINAYGPAAIAGNTACASIEGIASSVNTSVGQTALVFVGQNVGADNRTRVKKSILYATILNFVSCEVIGLLCTLFGRELLWVYLPGDAEAVAFALVRAKYVLAIYGIAGLINVFVSAQQAFGYSTLPMVNAFVGVFGFRFVWMCFVYPQITTPDCLYLCYSVSWSLTACMHLITLLIVYARYQKNKLKKL